MNSQYAHPYLPRPSGIPRTIITTDPELDDSNSLVRLLLYANEIEIAGLIYASSTFHWQGDGSTEFFLPGREYANPQLTWRWGDKNRFIDDAVDAYAAAFENLRVHDGRYPEPNALRAVIRVGNIAFEGDMAQPSPGSDLIKDVLLDDRDDPVYLQVWGGPSTIARALLSIEEQYSTTPGWTDLKVRVSHKAVILKFASQDETYEDYIVRRWPGIEVRDTQTNTWGYGARRTVLAQDGQYLSTAWHRANVVPQGALGALYRLWGDGRSMPGDHFDYFGERDLSSEALAAKGFWVWTEPQEPGSWTSEGDSSNFLNLLGNGLEAFRDPRWGGWAGRQAQNPQRPNEWLSTLAVDGTGSADNDLSAARWFGAAQRDFAARLAWSVETSYSAANHPPIVRLNHPRLVNAEPGETVRLSASVNDPDGDEVTVRWWNYCCAGDNPRELLVTESGVGEASVVIPEDAEPGSRLHLILEACDSGLPQLTSYARVMVTVRAAADQDLQA